MARLPQKVYALYSLNGRLRGIQVRSGVLGEEISNPCQNKTTIPRTGPKYYTNCSFTAPDCHRKMNNFHCFRAHLFTSIVFVSNPHDVEVSSLLWCYPLSLDKQFLGFRRQYYTTKCRGLFTHQTRLLDLEDLYNMLLRNIGNCLPKNTA
jgi:hypothetical protein